MKKAGIGCLGLIVVIFLLVVVGSVINGGKSSTPTAGSQQNQPARGSSDKPDEPSASPPQSASNPPSRSGTGIEFSQPVILNSGAVNVVGVLVTNTSDQVKSFTVKATFKTGDTIAATASGAVNDLRPGQRRAASLLASQAIPAAYDSARVDVDTMIAQRQTTAGADAAQKLTFGTPAVHAVGGISTVDVEVANGDNKPHSFMVSVGVLTDGELVAIASGAVNDLAAGQTKTAGLLTTGQIPDGAELLVGVDTMVK